MSNPDRMPVATAAKMAGIDPSRVYAWIRQDRMGLVTKRGTTTYVSYAEVAELERRMVKHRRTETKTRRHAA